jgi:geranylgeranyl diphosphate synthase type I
LAGDALLILAFDVLVGSEHPATADAVRMVTAAVQELLDGQHADLSFEQRAEVELADCARMAEGKTAALIGYACALGALFGGGTPEQVACLRDFGMHLGLAFQHVDDLLGIWETRQSPASRCTQTCAVARSPSPCSPHWPRKPQQGTN